VYHGSAVAGHSHTESNAVAAVPTLADEPAIW
jgi:hypothetical protein